jgi:hypothetical protein
MVQVANGRRQAWVGSNRKFVPPTKAGFGIEPDDQIVLAQLTEAEQREIAAREAAVQSLERALAELQTDQVTGYQRLTDQIQQANEGVNKRTVAARYDGTTAPTPADVPGVDTTAPATDWHSWFLWDQGAGNANTGYYYFAGGTATRVPDVEMSAGLLTYVNSGANENSWWLMIDDPVSGVADFIPWGKSTDLEATGPIYIEDNLVELAYEAGWLATKVNNDTGEIELTLAQEVKQRLADLEVDVDDLQSRTTAIEAEQETQNGRLDQQDLINSAQQTAIASIDTRLTANEALDTAQTGRLDGLDTKTDGLRTDVDRANADNVTQSTLLDGLRRDVDSAVAENTRQTQVEAQLRTDVDQAIAENTVQNTQIATLRTDVDRANADNVTQSTLLNGLRRDVDATVAENTRQTQVETQLRTDVDQAIAENTVQNTQIATLRTDVDQANADNVTQSTLLDGLRRDVDAAVAENTRQTQVEAQLRTDVNAAVAENTVQNSQIATLRTDVDRANADNVTQDGLITQLRTDVELRQTATQVLDAVNTRLKACNPIVPLDDADPRVTRMVTSVTISGTVFTRTTFTINLGESDFARTRLSEIPAPFEEVSDFAGAYPGSTHVMSFDSSQGEVPNGVMEAWFHKGFR